MYTLIEDDVLVALSQMSDESVDMVFADPPFNVGKKYLGNTNDDRRDYYAWCEEWVDECYRVLKPTGTFYHMTIDRHLEKVFPLMGKLGVFINLIKWRNVSARHNKRTFWNSTQPILMYGKTEGYKFNTYAQTRPRQQLVVSWSKDRAKRTKGQMLDYWSDISPVFAGSIKHPESILRPGTNKKMHLAQMPTGLSNRCILFSTDAGDVVLDPFNGSGTTGESCIKLERVYIGIDQSKAYIEMTRKRLDSVLLQPALPISL
jgi:DNA modification methylase